MGFDNDIKDDMISALKSSFFLSSTNRKAYPRVSQRFVFVFCFQFNQFIFISYSSIC